MTGSSTVSTVALVLGVFGSLLAVASLSWQIATFKMSGSRIKVKLKIAGLGPTGVLTGLVDSNWCVNLQRYAALGYTPCLAIEARNVGRLGVDIIRCKALFSNGVGYDPGHPANPPSDYRLEHGQTKSWFVDIAPIQSVVDTAPQHYRKDPKAVLRRVLFDGFTPPDIPDGAQRIKLSLELGTGKIKKTRERFFLVPNPAVPVP